jgi:REP element-mobilizing transposase RayT
MPKPRPSYQIGFYYHFFNRGANKLSIFREAENYMFTLRKLKQYSNSLQIKVIAYCLLPNHYHLLVRQEGENSAGLLPQRVFNSYSKAFNNWFDHSGTLFEDNYKVILLENPSHLLHLCRYIHANPVIHGLAKEPEDWPYSNYLEWIGRRNGTLFDSDFVRENFGGHENYRQFLMDLLTGKDELPEALSKQIGVLLAG